MLIYNLHERGNIPIYEFLYNCIREDIKSGRLSAGTRLPSKRELASGNGIAVITVENAYEQLLIEGYIESVPRVGYFVADIAIDYAEDDSPGLGADDGNMSVEADSSELSVLDFDSSRLIRESFPYNTWSKLMRRVLSDREKDFAVSPQASGVFELRKAIAGYLHSSKNLAVDYNSIIVGPGTEYLHSVLIQLIGRNRIVAVEDPGYKKAGLIYESNGMKVMHIPLDDEGIMVERLYDSNVSLVHISPAHHFPTGTVMSASRRYKLLKWATDQASYIIEDDYDSEFRFKGKPLPALMSLDSEHVVYMNTFTGSLVPSIRIAYMVLPSRLMQAYNEKLSFASGTVSTFEQLSLAMFISEGYYERHIGRMRNRYRKLRDRFKSALAASKLSSYACIEDDRAGLHMILDIDFGENDTAAFLLDRVFISELEKRDIAITPVTEYCYNRAKLYVHKFVLHYIELEEAYLIETFDKMSECVETALEYKGI